MKLMQLKGINTRKIKTYGTMIKEKGILMKNTNALG
jgi:hypothetical protein